MIVYTFQTKPSPRSLRLNSLFIHGLKQLPIGFEQLGSRTPILNLVLNAGVDERESGRNEGIQICRSKRDF